jgi:hypothetical protein
MPFLLAFIGALIVMSGWLAGISYVDFLVARYRRTLGPGAPGTRIAVQRVLGMPWDLTRWIISGAIVFLLALIFGLMGVGALVLLVFVGVAVMSGFVLANWSQLWQESPSDETTGPGPAVEAWLYGVAGELAGQYVRLSNAELAIGRGAGNQLVLRDLSVSRHHARVRFGQGAWYLQDNGSGNGVFVNGRRIEAVRLKSGDQITIGGSTFVFGP